MRKQFIILFLGIISISNAQIKEIEIFGKIKTSLNDKGIPDLNILSISQGHGVQTDSLGNYSYKIKDWKNKRKIELNLSKLGYYKDTIINLTDQNRFEFNLTLKPHLGIDKEKALNDIEKGNICILMSGGIAPIHYKSDGQFSKKYKVNFVEFGCEGVGNDALSVYNNVVFDFLDKKFGVKWRKEIRSDIIGLKK
ncbi:hypothetical protein [Thalassobellus suaedae]|uniref:Carboxypeptidase-like regulatory domain-containing protein n=1 Tax=Thalassobellus suaedae TaxID=3074124 RepID=A0ABY9XY92_9FLAO|nr:hypothetical protein RHP51_09355 [Flavobacteriaceae bacterium HL-DH14]